jgi:hypothetical protein
VDQSIEEKLDEFITLIDELNTLKSIGNNKIFANHLREFLSDVEIGQWIRAI